MHKLVVLTKNLIEHIIFKGQQYWEWVVDAAFRLGFEKVNTQAHRFLSVAFILETLGRSLI